MAVLLASVLLDSNLMGKDDFTGIPTVSSRAHCTDGTNIGNFMYSQTERVVLIVWFIPAVLGVIMGEVVILYMGLCNFPQYLLHHWLTHSIRDLRPFNCANNHYEVDYASPCLSTMIMWSMTGFIFLFSILRRMSRMSSNRRAPPFRMNNMGYTLLASSIFVTCSVVYTKNNTWGQSLLGSLVGVLYGLGCAVFLEYVWAPSIPYLIKIFPLNLKTYTDTFYFYILCDCKVEDCSHRTGGRVMRYMTKVFDKNPSQEFSSSSNMEEVCIRPNRMEHVKRRYPRRNRHKVAGIYSSNILYQDLPSSVMYNRPLTEVKIGSEEERLKERRTSPLSIDDNNCGHLTSS